MHLPKGLRTNRAFIKKAFNFIKYYPLKRKDPADMLLRTLKELTKWVNCAKSLDELEPLSQEVQLIGNYSKHEQLFQIEVVGERDRFIIYKPSKFFKKSKKTASEIVYIYDLLYIPRKKD